MKIYDMNESVLLYLYLTVGKSAATRTESNEGDEGTAAVSNTALHGQHRLKHSQTDAGNWKNAREIGAVTVCSTVGPELARCRDEPDSDTLRCGSENFN